MDISNKKIYYSGVNALRLAWHAGLSVKYGVLITFNNGTDSINEVKYEVQVTRLKPGIAGQPLFQIERTSDVFINETLPDLIADKLAYAVGKVFYPLIIEVDSHGGFQSIYNHEEILKRWQPVKKAVFENFEGHLVEDYISRMEKLLANPDQVTHAFFNNDWFIHTFFKPLYKEYGANLTTTSMYRFPIARNFNVEGYLTAEKLSSETNNFGAIALQHEGKIMAVTDEMLLTSNDEGHYEAYYLLHPKFRRIVSVVSDFSYDQEKVRVKITLIPEKGQEFDHDFELEGNVKGMPVTEMVIIDGNANKSFWNRVLNR